MNMELYHRIKFASVNIRKFLGFDCRDKDIVQQLEKLDFFCKKCIFKTGNIPVGIEDSISTLLMFKNFLHKS